ncbi:MAG: N-acetyltransferase [Homoserinimonas sp.]|nr:N-acetyltransferase [Homoserinimonas sp.]
MNAETKLLMLGLAFESACERVKIQADAVNTRSRAATERIGATFEGVLRHDMRRADGTWRDTAVHSVLAGEWPQVCTLLTTRLRRYDAPWNTTLTARDLGSR